MGITQYFRIDLPEVKNDRNEKEAKVPQKNGEYCAVICRIVKSTEQANS